MNHLNVFSSGELQGIMIVIENLLIFNKHKVNIINVTKALEKLKLEKYTDSVVSTYFK